MSRALFFVSLWLCGSITACVKEVNLVKIELGGKAETPKRPNAEISNDDAGNAVTSGPAVDGSDPEPPPASWPDVQTPDDILQEIIDGFNNSDAGTGPGGQAPGQP